MPAPKVVENTLTDAERGQLVMSCQKLCKRLAGEAVRRAGGSFPGMDFGDVEGEAVLACVEAARRWDPTVGASFATYAWTCITRHLGQVRTAAHARVDNQIEDWDMVPDRAADRPEPDDLPPPEVGPDFAALAVLVRDALAAGVLDTLTPGHRRLVERVAFDGLSPHQIAVQDGHPVKIVRANLKTALRKLAAAGLTQKSVTDDQVRAATAPQNPTTADWQRRQAAARAPVAARQNLDRLARALAAGDSLPGLTEGVRSVLRMVADRSVTLDQAFDLLGPDVAATGRTLRMAVVRLSRGGPVYEAVRAAFDGMGEADRAAALAGLTRRFRGSVRLAVLDGLGVDGAAARLGVQPDTVRKHLAAVARGLVRAASSCDATPKNPVAA